MENCKPRARLLRRSISVIAASYMEALYKPWTEAQIVLLFVGLRRHVVPTYKRTNKARKFLGCVGSSLVAEKN